jgi:hypothetical protein
MKSSQRMVPNPTQFHPWFLAQKRPFGLVSSKEKFGVAFDIDGTLTKWDTYPFLYKAQVPVDATRAELHPILQKANFQLHAKHVFFLNTMRRVFELGGENCIVTANAYHHLPHFVLQQMGLSEAEIARFRVYRSKVFGIKVKELTQAQTELGIKFRGNFLFIDDLLRNRVTAEEKGFMTYDPDNQDPIVVDRFLNSRVSASPCFLSR